MSTKKKSSQKDVGSSESNAQSQRRPRILIADDDPDLRRLLRTHLETMDCELIEANDGEKALETIIIERPDLVVLDVMMPELNGWEVCRYIKSKPEYASIGVVMLTAIGSTINELTSPLYGADEYIDKPFNIDELEFKIRRVLSRMRSQRS
ncbi:MAG: response regulator [Myxococcota bacterium]|jgi:DNA-binding response OmpR family regulator|nr:response regulator [Myxococcota bacterium]